MNTLNKDKKTIDILLKLFVIETQLYMKFRKTGKIDKKMYNKWLKLEQEAYEQFTS